MSLVLVARQYLPTRDLLEVHEDLLREFLADTFSMDPDEVPVSDQTQLADFTGSWPRWIGGGATSRRANRAQWDSWLLNDILSRYGVVAAHGVATRLVDLLDGIAAHRRHCLARPH